MNILRNTEDGLDIASIAGADAFLHGLSHAVWV